MGGGGEGEEGGGAFEKMSGDWLGTGVSSDFGVPFQLFI